MEQISQKIQELNGLLSAEGQPFALGFYDPNKLKLLETNARYMPNDKFAALVSNVKRDGGLASVPLVYAFEEPDTPLVLSGNHRVMAARQATGHQPILVFTILTHKSIDELVAIQLSHNAIAGADDLQTLKKLYEKISQIDMKVYSGLDEDTVKKLDAIKFEPISEPRLIFKTVTFLFLPSETDEIEAMVSQVAKVLDDENAFAFQVRDYQEFFNRLADAKAELKIKNSATAILELMRAGARQIEAERTARDAAAAVEETTDAEPIAA